MSKPGLPLFRKLVADRVAEAMQGRAEIQSAPDDTTRAIQEQRHRSLEQRIAPVRQIGDAVIAAFFAEDKPRPRKLVEVKDLKIVVAVEGAEFGNAKRRVRGRFTLNGAQYWLSVTDPVVERRYLQGANGEFGVGHAILCTSLGEPYGGYAYKLIAGVFLKPQERSETI